ncbi:tetratricopeptide repeat protein [Candidatus Chlorohelix sp.]|uniref:tetratricopeptide repeat protein n=1 Tax=Candidatus Chlorohelix sp. TaxID=3139201 RepID=UPI003020DDE1
MASPDNKEQKSEMDIAGWLESYYRAVEGTGASGNQQTGASYELFAFNLNPEESGDFVAQFDRLLASVVAKPGLSLEEIARNNRRVVLLGRPGSGKSTMLRDFWVKQVQLARATSPNPAPLLPIYLELEKGAKQQDVFQNSLQSALARAGSAGVPANLFKQTTPLLLIDSLDLLEPAVAPAFMYALNRWCRDEAPDARVIITCRYLSFALYHPWFREEQQWNFFGVIGLALEQVRKVLVPRLSDTDAKTLEQSGLMSLFTNPALLRSTLESIPAFANLRTLLQSLLNTIFDGKSEWASGLLRWLGFADGHSKEIEPEWLDRMLNLGIFEKHPVAGWTRLLEPSLKIALGAWYSLAASPETLPATLERVLSGLDKNEAAKLTRLLYSLTKADERHHLFNAILGHKPDSERLNMALNAGQSDPDILERFGEYLSRKSTEAPELLRSFATINEANSSPQRLRIAEKVLELLLQDGHADDTLHLNLARVKEQLGKGEEALDTFMKLSRHGSVPALEGELGAVRLLSKGGCTEQATSRLEEMRRNLQEYQAEIDHQTALIYRDQGNHEEALVYAKRAGFKGNRPQRAAVYRHNMAQILAKLGKNERAEQELTELITEYPDFAEAYYDLGKLQLERGDTTSALNHFKRAVELNGTSSRYLYEMGRAWLAEGRYEEAFQYLQAAVDKEDVAPEYFTLLGLAALKLGKAAEAREACSKGLSELKSEMGRLNPETLIYLAAAEYNLGNYTEASSALFRAIELEPSNPLLHLISGVVMEAGGYVLPAAESYRKSINLALTDEHAPVAYEAILHLSRRLRQEGQHLEAQEVLADVKSSTPEILHEKGMLALEQKRYRDAADYFGQGIAQLDKAASPLSLLTLFFQPQELVFELPFRQALALREQGQHSQAQKMLRALLSEKEKNNSADLPQRRAAIHHQLGKSMLEQQNLREALPFLRVAAADVPNNAEYRLSLAKGWLIGGDFERAQNELNAAHDLEPDMPEIYAEMAELQLASRKLDTPALLTTLNLYQKALKYAPNNSAYLARAALLAYRLEYRNQSAEMVQRLLKFASEMAQAHLLAACLAERSGEIEKARSEAALAVKAPENPGYYLVAARLARKARAFDQMERYFEPLNERNQLPLALQAALRYEEGERAMAENRQLEAAGFFRLAIELRQHAEAEDAPSRLEDIYYDDEGNFEDESVALEAAYRMDYARALLELGKLEQAHTELDTIISLNPDSAKAHSALGEVQELLNLSHDSLLSFKHAADLRPTPSNLYRLGQAYLKGEGESQRAIEYLERAASHEMANRSDYHASLGYAYRQAARFGEARAAYTRALQLDSQNPELHMAVADTFLGEGDRLAAVQPLQEAVLSAPDNPAYRFELAALFEELGWLQEASAEYKQATELSPAEAKAWLKSGEVLIRTGKIDAARNALEKAVALEGHDPAAQHALGKLYLDSFGSIRKLPNMLPPDLAGMFGTMPGADTSEPKNGTSAQENNAPDPASLQKARTHLSQAAALSPQTEEYLMGMAQAEFLTENYETAEIACQNVLRINPNNYEASLLLAESSLRLGRSNLAWGAAQQAIKLYKHREDAWLLAARAASMGEREERSIDCLQLYLKLNKGQIIGPLAYILMARSYLALNQAETALEQMEHAQARMKAMFSSPGYAFMVLMARIMRQLEQGTEALDYYRYALQLNPQDPALHNEMGEAYLEQQKFEDSVNACRKALQIEPNNSAYHYNAGIAALRIATTPGQYSRRPEAYRQQAIDFLNKAIQLNPEMANYWYDLAQAYSTITDYSQMKKALEQAISRSAAFESADAPQAKYMRFYAFTCLKLGENEEARQTLQKLREALPDDHQSVNDLGEISLLSGRYSEAYNFFRSAEHLSNDHPRYLANMSRALLKMNRLHEARELIEDALKFGADDHYVLHQHGAVLLENGMAELALDKLQAAAEKEPSNPEFRYYLGRAYLELNLLPQAANEYMDALQLAPNQHRWHAELGEIYLQERAYLHALESFRVAVNLDPLNIDYRYNMAIALAANGELQQAIHLAREVLDQKGAQVGAEWHYLIGRLLCELGRYDDAQGYFEYAHQLQPENPHYKVDFARIQRLRGAPIEDIRTLLEEAVEAIPGDPHSLQEFAYLQEMEDDLEGAIQTMERGLSDVLDTVRTS